MKTRTDAGTGTRTGVLTMSLVLLLGGAALVIGIRAGVRALCRRAIYHTW